MKVQPVVYLVVVEGLHIYVVTNVHQQQVPVYFYFCRYCVVMHRHTLVGLRIPTYCNQLGLQVIGSQCLSFATK